MSIQIHFNITQASKYLGVTSQTIRRWDREGLLDFPLLRDENNQRIFTLDQLGELSRFRDSIRKRNPGAFGGSFRQ